VTSPSTATFPQQQIPQQLQQQGGLNKFDATIVQMRQGQGPPGADPSARNPLPPPIVSIPLSRE
jgi:hypothetical protein